MEKKAKLEASWVQEAYKAIKFLKGQIFFPANKLLGIGLVEDYPNNLHFANLRLLNNLVFKSKWPNVGKGSVVRQIQSINEPHKIPSFSPSTFLGGKIVSKNPLAFMASTFYSFEPPASLTKQGIFPFKEEDLRMLNLDKHSPLTSPIYDTNCFNSNGNECTPLLSRDIYTLLSYLSLTHPFPSLHILTPNYNSPKVRIPLVLKMENHFDELDLQWIMLLGPENVDSGRFYFPSNSK